MPRTSLTITVTESNSAPLLAAIATQTAVENTLLTVTASGTDADLPADTLTYSLVTAPTGATINPTTGVFDGDVEVELTARARTP